MNLHPSKHFPNSSRSPSQTLAFISLTPRPTNQLTLPSFSLSNTPRRVSCSHHPSLSPSTLTTESSQTPKVHAITHSSTFAYKNIRKLSVFPSRSSSKRQLSSDKTDKLKESKDVQSILKNPAIGLADRLSRVEGVNSRTPSVLDSSFNSAFSEKLISLGRSSRALSIRNRQKNVKLEDQTDEKIQLGKVIRRKSCHCSDCGGLSKKEKTHMNVVATCPRTEMLRLKLSLVESKDDSEGLGSTRSNKSIRRMSRKSFAFKVTPRSLNTLQPRLSVKPALLSMKTMAFLGRDGETNSNNNTGVTTARQSYSLSKFAAAKKYCTLNVLHDEDESMSKNSLSRKGTIEKINKANTGKSISEFLAEDHIEAKESLTRNSIEEMGEVQPEKKRNPRYTPSLDLDLVKPSEDKKSLDEEEENELEQENEPKSKMDNQEKRVPTDEPSILRQVNTEPKATLLTRETPLGELRKVRIEKYAKTIAPATANVSKVDQSGRKEKKYLNLLDLKTQKKVKELAIQQIYTVRSSPFISGLQSTFKSPKSQLGSKIGNERIKDFFEKRKMTADTMCNLDENNMELQRKSYPVAMFESARVLQNVTPSSRNCEPVKKNGVRGHSMSARKNIERNDDRQGMTERLRITTGEKSGYARERSEKGEASEMVLLKSSSGKRRRIKTISMGAGELKKVYKASM